MTSGVEGTEEFDRVEPTVWRGRWRNVVLSLVLLLSSGLSFFTGLLDPRPDGWFGRAYPIFSVLFLLIIAVYIVVWIARPRVQLGEESIEYRPAWGRTREFRYASIARVRLDPADAGLSILLEVDGARHTIPGPAGGHRNDPARDRDAAVAAIRRRCPHLVT